MKKNKILIYLVVLIPLITFAEDEPLIHEPPKTISELSSKHSAPFIERIESSFIYSGMVWDGQSYDTANFQVMEFNNKSFSYENILKQVKALRGNGLRVYGLLSEDEKILNDFVAQSIQKYTDAKQYILIEDNSFFKIEADGTIIFSNGPWSGNYEKCGGNGTLKNFGKGLVATKLVERNITCLKPTNLVGEKQFRLKLPPEIYRTYTQNTYFWRHLYLVVRRVNNTKWNIDRYKLTLPVIAESFYISNDNGEILFGANLKQVDAVNDQTVNLSKSKTTKDTIAKEKSNYIKNAPIIKRDSSKKQNKPKAIIDITGE